ncbi:OmpA/MotB domain protein [Sulfitobacter noctilucae]|uniref:OmpA family protein n=1 Tax=Sulfitobacter noctilucae TaxID=1342302 RepID=UPI0004692526|nr:OmpA family protein [Sulfitobacter noctilucae]KIN65396.1 OmpA/MotB domain protein [Sulfitobacter noctilucae]
MRRADKSQHAEINRLRGVGLSLAQANRVAQNRRGGNGPLVLATGVGMALTGAIAVFALGLSTPQTIPAQTAKIAQSGQTAMLNIESDVPHALPQTLATPPSPDAFAVIETDALAPEEATRVRDALLAARGDVDMTSSADTVTRNQPALLAQQQDCVAELDAFLGPRFVQFNLGQTRISSDNAVLLEEVSARIIGCKQAYVMIAGHADAVGDDLTNLALSWERADRTLAHLVELGVDLAAIEAVGYGARAPVSQGSDEDLGTDRRVDFRVMTRREPRE